VRPASAPTSERRAAQQRDMKMLQIFVTFLSSKLALNSVLLVGFRLFKGRDHLKKKKKKREKK